nr:hypothetical protein [Pseudomonas sp. A46]
MVNELAEVLRRARFLAGSEFTGVGVIVCDLNIELPTFPLRLGVSIPQREDVAISLAEVSRAASDLHDGFHVLTPEFHLVALSQYFSPPIVKTAAVNRTRNFGGRYVAALFGSTLPGVHLCGIATESLGVVIFRHGHEVYFESA